MAYLAFITLVLDFAVPTSAPAATKVTPALSPRCDLSTALASWSDKRLAEQTIVVPVAENDVSAVTSEVRAGAGGVVLFGSVASPTLRRDLSVLARTAPGGIAPFVMLDEEGGAVQRMANLVGSVPSARTMGKTMTASEIQRLARTLGEKLKANGVTMDLAPVLDVDGGQGPNNSNADGTRSFSANPSIAAHDGVAFAKGLAQGGVTAVVKHFPGLGGASGNTDLEPASTLAWTSEQKVGLLPFKRAIAAKVPAVMISNASVPGLTSLPSSISSAVISGELRTQLGYSGLVLTDSLSVKSLSSIGYSIPRASVAALVAGADLLLFSSDAATEASTTSSIENAIVQAVRSRTLTRAHLIDAVTYILRAKGVNLCS